MLSFFLIYDFAESCTIGKAWFWCEFAFVIAPLGLSIVFMAFGALQKWVKVHKKAFQGTAVVSYCIYHLLVLPLFFYWTIWVTSIYWLCSLLFIPINLFISFKINFWPIYLNLFFLSFEKCQFTMDELSLKTLHWDKLV